MLCLGRQEESPEDDHQKMILQLPQKLTAATGHHDKVIGEKRNVDLCNDHSAGAIFIEKGRIMWSPLRSAGEVRRNCVVAEYIHVEPDKHEEGERCW